MGINESANRADVNEFVYRGVTVSVGVTQIEAKVAATRDPDRQVLIIYNDSSVIIYYGPTGVAITGSAKGIPLLPQQEVAIPVGNVGVFLIAGTASNNAIVQEFG